MFSVESGDFLNNPLSFGFNSIGQVIIFFHIFDFQGPSTRQMDQIFLTHNFLGIKNCEKKSTWNSTRGRKEGAPCGKTSWPRGGSHLPLVGIIATNFGSMKSS
jgi:hypothetical protein